MRDNADNSSSDPLMLAVVEAARGLVGKLEAIHANEEYKSVWTLSHIHGSPYKGPTYEKELKTTLAALAALDAKQKL